MTGFKEFAGELKKLFNIRKDNVSKPYEITYVTLTGLEDSLVVNINNEKLTLEMKKYSFSAPDVKPVNFYRVVAQFQKNIYYNSSLKLSFDEEATAKKFYSKVSHFIQKAMLEA